MNTRLDFWSMYLIQLYYVVLRRNFRCSLRTARTTAKTIDQIKKLFQQKTIDWIKLLFQQKTIVEINNLFEQKRIYSNTIYLNTIYVNTIYFNKSHLVLKKTKTVQRVSMVYRNISFQHNASFNEHPHGWNFMQKITQSYNSN